MDIRYGGEAVIVDMVGFAGEGMVVAVVGYMVHVVVAAAGSPVVPPDHTPSPYSALSPFPASPSASAAACLPHAWAAVAAVAGAVVAAGY